MDTTIYRTHTHIQIQARTTHTYPHIHTYIHAHISTVVTQWGEQVVLIARADTQHHRQVALAKS